MTIKQQAITGIKWNGISMGAVNFLQAVTLVVLSRLLSPSDFGLMGMVMVAIGFAQVFADVGISNAIIHRQDVTKDQLSSLYWLNIVAGIVVFCVICASSPLIAVFYREPRLINLLYLMAVTVLIIPLGQQFQILLQKDLKFDILAKIDIAAALVNSIVAIGLAFTGFGVFSLIWGQLAAALARALLLSYAGWPQYRPFLHAAKSDLKDYLGFGLYQLGERVTIYLNASFDHLLIGAMLGTEALGYYALAYNLIIKSAAVINPVITKVAFPVFSIMQHETDRLKKYYLKVLNLLSFANFPLMAGLAVVAPVAVPVIFGNQWHNSIILIQILAIVGLLKSTGNPIGLLLLAKGRADLGFKWHLVRTITQVPALYIGVRLGGTIGLAIAFVFVTALHSILIYLILIRKMLGPCLAEYVQSMWPPLLMSGIMAGGVIVVSTLFQGVSPSASLIVQIFCGVLFFMCLLFYNQKEILNEIKHVLFKREGIVIKE
jgi:lipopolysaccharide exporter